MTETINNVSESVMRDTRRGRSGWITSPALPALLTAYVPEDLTKSFGNEGS